MAMILKIVVSIVVFILIAIFIKYLKIHEYEKKFSEFSLSAKKEENLSFFDQIKKAIWNLIYLLSSLLNHSNFIKKYSMRFKQDIYLHKKIKSEIDIVSMKILIGLLLIVIFIFSSLIQSLHIHIWQIILIYFIGYIALNPVLKYTRVYRKEKLKEGLLKAILMINGCLQAGQNIVQAIEIVANELTGPIAEEFKKIAVDLSYGLGLDITFNRFYKRVELKEAKYIVTSLSLLNQTSGSIPKLFEMIETNLLNEKKVEEELKNLTKTSIFVFRLIVFTPLFLIEVICLINAKYFNVLFTTSIGKLVSILLVLFYILSIFVARKVLQVRI